MSIEWFHSQQKQFPSLQVKTLDAKGQVPVIKFSDKGEWLKPKEWAHNHLAHLLQQYSELQARIYDCGSDPTSVCSSRCSILAQKDGDVSNDLTKVEALQALVAELESQFDAIKYQYRCTYTCLLNVAKGKGLSSDIARKLLESQDTINTELFVRKS